MSTEADGSDDAVPREDDNTFSSPAGPRLDPTDPQPWAGEALATATADACCCGGIDPTSCKCWRTAQVCLDPDSTGSIAAAAGTFGLPPTLLVPLTLPLDLTLAYLPFAAGDSYPSGLPPAAGPCTAGRPPLPGGNSTRSARFYCPSGTRPTPGGNPATFGQNLRFALFWNTASGEYPNCCENNLLGIPGIGGITAINYVPLPDCDTGRWEITYAWSLTSSRNDLPSATGTAVAVITRGPCAGVMSPARAVRPHPTAAVATSKAFPRTGSCCEGATGPLRVR